MEVTKETENEHERDDDNIIDMMEKELKRKNLRK